MALPYGESLESGPPPTERKRYLRRFTALKNERSQWDAHWRDLAEHIRPTRSRFLEDRPNEGAKKNERIINGTATWAARTLAAGMMSGVTSPARPWFRLTTPDPALAEFGAVKEWLHVVENRLFEAFAKSNVYKALPIVYSDLGVPGTAAMLVEQDIEDGLRAYVFPIGSFCLANSPRQSVDTIYRQVSFTVGQLVKRFGEEKCSQRVRNLFKQAHLEDWVKVLHVIEPNDAFEPQRMGAAGKQWTSAWFELDPAEDNSIGYLLKGGYNEFPAMCPRWETTGEDVYGRSPAMDALGDIRGLQVLEKRSAQGLEKIINPPMVGPASLRNQNVSMVPGSVTYVDGSAHGMELKPAVMVPPQAYGLASAEKARYEERIQRALYADLWLMLASSDKSQMTAREVAERHEEKLLQLGSVMENLQDELLEPLIDRAFAIGLRQGWFPPPPEELQGGDLRVEFIGLLSQAQKLVRTSGHERLVGFVTSIFTATQNPDVLDKVDFDQLVDEYADSLGVPPKVVRTDEDVEAIRAQRAQQAAEQQALEVAAQAPKAVSDLAKADMSGDTALNRVVGNLGPVAAAAAGQQP